MKKLIVKVDLESGDTMPEAKIESWGSDIISECMNSDSDTPKEITVGLNSMITAITLAQTIQSTPDEMVEYVYEGAVIPCKSCYPKDVPWDDPTSSMLLKLF